MNKPFPFEKVWFGVDLDELRPIDATYGGEPFELLPTINQKYLDGNFSYLSNQTVKEIDEKVSDHVDKRFKPTKEKDILKIDPKWQKKVEKIQQNLPNHLVLPASLVKFMSAPIAQDLIPSCTACYFDLPDSITPFNWLDEKGYIFHFYRDQQDCLFWYYYVRETGESCILASAIPFEEEGIENELTDEIIKQEVFYTAENFEEFIYRTWIENILWFNIEEGEGTDPNTQKLCEEYVNHYKQLKK